MKRHPAARGKTVSGGPLGSCRVVIVTGLSGSGKTVALRALEDSNFFCVDNLPVSLIGSLVSKLSKTVKRRNIAVGIDIREREFLAGINRVLAELKKTCNPEILFLEAEKEVIIRRFKETRRPHPLGGNIEDAIGLERENLSLLRDHADKVLDTSSLSPHQLRNMITSLYLPRVSAKAMTVSIMSFGFKYGVPQNIDLLFDVRFLPNPHFVPSLSPLNGLDERVSSFVLKHRDTREFISQIKTMLSFLMPRFIKEGRSYLSIAIGCTGGKHRSPAITEAVARFLKRYNIELSVIHRELS